MNLTHFIYIVNAMLLLAADWFLAREFNKAAIMKGCSGRKYFWICFILPLAGYLLVIALPDRGGAELSVIESDDLPEL